MQIVITMQTRTKTLRLSTFVFFARRSLTHPTKRGREKKNRNKTHLTSHHHAHFPFNWSVGFLEEFKAHAIGWYWQQSRLIATGLGERLGGSQVSNVWGDNLGVDENDLSQLKHFGTEFVLGFFFFTYRLGFERTTPTRITLSGSEPHASAEPWSWSHCLTSRPPHDRERERGKWDFIVQS